MVKDGVLLRRGRRPGRAGVTTSRRGEHDRRFGKRPMKTIRWGIIGCGDVTEVKSGPGFYKARALAASSPSCAATARWPPTTRGATACRAGTTMPTRSFARPTSTPSTSRPRPTRIASTCCAARPPASRCWSRSRWRWIGSECDEMIAACAAARRAAVGRVLPARAAALPRGARSRARRRDRPGADGSEPAVPDAARAGGR